MMENDFELTDNLDELCDIGDGQIGRASCRERV